MRELIPKEKLTAYQRWEIAAFDEQQRAESEIEDEPILGEPAKEAEVEPRVVEPITAQEVPSEPVIALPTAEEIDQIHREAHATGYTAGYAAGFQEGIVVAQETAKQMARLMDGLQQALTGVDQAVADQLLALAIDIARQVLRQSLRVRPELLLPVVREAVSALHGHGGQALLFVNPADGELVREHLGEQLAHRNWRILDDPTLTAGGCRVEVAASEVDATLETRWRRVIETIGINEDWLPSEKSIVPGDEHNRRQ
ncbi:MAG: flagellar assembly protein FliH [Candidatus Accumulibacter sp.]|nr:flagellar assembly protein FliH [Accumulibacter sp.]